MEAATRTPAEISEAAATYIYGYPLLYNLEETAKFAGGTGPVKVDGWNTFGSARQLIGPEAKFVSPNNDTLYLIGCCDVSGGPVVLHVPDTRDRYYVLQFVDAWTNNFAYVGRRPTGTAEGEFLLAPAGYDGAVPEGMSLISAPSDVFVIVGRVQVDGEADLEAVHALQDEFTLSTLNGHESEPAGLPSPDPTAREELGWWERLRVALFAFPPPEGDAPFLEAAARLGVTDTTSPFVDPDASLASALVEGEQQGRAMIEKLAGQSAEPVNGWTTGLHMFDYNLDRCGLGTVDSPAWKIADRKQAYLTRAVIARAGLWGNHGYEADYEFAWQDENGEDLDGSRSYELTLAPPPSVDAFWSLTMYDLPDFYLVANPINRYSIGDRTPGLKYGDDGSVTLYLAANSPGEDKEANWLPAPNGQFRPVLRMYQPRSEILDGNYTPPAIKRR